MLTIWVCNNCVFYWQGRQNMQSRRKWVGGVLGSILTSFWMLLGGLGEAKMRQSRFQEGVEKIIDFRDPLFSVFGWFWMPRGVQKAAYAWPFFGSFPILGAIFFCSGAILAHFYGFWCFRNPFFMIFEEFPGSEIRKRSCILLQIFEQKSARFSQDSGRSRQDS